MSGKKTRGLRNMKVVIALILMILLVCTASACSLPLGAATGGTQSEGTSLDGNMQAASDDINQAASGEASSNSGQLAGEEPVKGKLVKAVLFFATPDNKTLKQEEQEIRVIDGAILKACMLALIKGPQTQELVGTIPEGTVVRGISVKDKVATVDLSKEFNQADGEAGIIARLSIVNTLTKISGIEKVRFHIEGEDMIDSQGSPIGAISPVLLNADGASVSGN